MGLTMPHFASPPPSHAKLKSQEDKKKLTHLPYRPCVGLMLVDDQGRVFLGRRCDTPGAWQMPQGGIDKGETPQVAALRELKEEIGCDAAEILAQSAKSYRYDLPEHLLGKVWGGAIGGRSKFGSY
jgi:putative (di)nucleoside polyphosphate hydrolase